MLTSSVLTGDSRNLRVPWEPAGNPCRAGSPRAQLGGRQCSASAEATEDQRAAPPCLEVDAVARLRTRRAHADADAPVRIRPRSAVVQPRAGQGFEPVVVGV